MIDHLKGRLAGGGRDHVVVECAGIGFRAYVSAATRRDLPPDGEACVLRTWLSVREGGADLYGFSSETEREIFVSLLGVGGVGPKSALAVLSGLGVPEILAACAREDAAVFTKVTGIGKKLAQRIAHELPEKLRRLSLPMPEGAEAEAPPSPPEAEAAAALVALGFSRAEAHLAVARVRRDAGREAPPDALVREALRRLSGPVR